MFRVYFFSLSLLLAALPLLAQEPKLGRKVALLVGINDYNESGLGNLKCAGRDATDLRDILVNKLGYDKRDVYLMTTTEALLAKKIKLLPTRANILANLKGLSEELTKDDTVFIAFSGHGVQLKALKDKALHLCPSDANLEKPETLISVNEIFTQLKVHCKAGLKILLLDACRNDPADGRAGSDEKLESVTRPLIPKPEGGTVAFFSCSEGQKAYENEKAGRGFFTDSVIRGLLGAAANKEGEVTIPLLEDFLQKDVPSAVKRVKGLNIRQTPERLGDLRGRTLLAKVAPGTSPDAPLKGGEEREFEIHKEVKMKFCWIPAGEAQLGSQKEEQDNVTKKNKDGKRPFSLDEETEAARGKFKTTGFWLGKYEVTQQEWKGVLDNNPSRFRGDKLPVERISWIDCQTFIKKCEVKGFKLELPHENQWEYACRGGLGNKQPYYWGDSLNGDKANCMGIFPFGTTTEGVALLRTTEVGNYERVAPHPWGLCDMHGNVAEWCENVRTTKGPGQVIRGGRYNRDAENCRSARRDWTSPSSKYDSVGCRLLLLPLAEDK